MKKINYFVIGGQYKFYNYGGSETLLGAKRLATKNMEYHDNWVGWVKPSIYRAEDCRNGYPEYGSVPVAEWDDDSKRWITT